MNRQLTGRLATIHFAPTPRSRNNLIQEHIPDSQIYITGNTVIDALLWVVNKIQANSSLQQQIQQELDQVGYDTNRLHREQRRLVLITGHRRENFGIGFLSICRAIQTLVERYPKVDFVYPMHLNPQVRQPIQQIFGTSDHPRNLFFIEPLSYLPFVFLMEQASIVLTDSGGIQEEAPSLGKPVLVMRNTTERPEAVEAGTVKLVGTDIAAIVNQVSQLLDSNIHYQQMSQASNPYGDGKACHRIVEILKSLP